jgi:sugar phosphate isomerase/epimerase
MCDSCRQALAGGLLAVSHNPDLANLKGITIVAGHHRTPPEVGNDKVLLYGNCTYPLRHMGHYETGCPPLAFQVAEGLRALKPRTIRPSMCSIAWRDEPIESIIPLVARAGYLGLEAWGPHLDRYVQEQGALAPLAQTLADHRLSAPMISGYFDLDKEPESSLELAQRYAGYAAILKSPLLRVFTRGGDSAQASIGTWRKVVATLRELCQIGADQGLAYAIETHGGHLHNTTETTLRLIRQVGAPNLGVNLDIFNLFAIGEDPLRALKRSLPWLRIVHLKNAVRAGATYRNGAPLAQGAMDYRPFLLALAEANYGGYASIEWFGPDPSGAAFSEMAYLREVLGDKLEVRAQWISVTY